MADDATTAAPAGLRGWAAQGADTLAAPAGLRGWAAQGADTLAAPAGLRGWAAQGADTLAAPAGLRGWAAQGADTLAAPAGLRGWAAHTALNLRLTVLLPPDQDPADTYVPLTLALDYGGAEYLELPYAPGGHYALAAPPGVLLTLATLSSRYQPQAQELTLEPGQEQTLTVQLAFQARAQPQATKVRRRPHRPG